MAYNNTNLVYVTESPLLPSNGRLFKYTTTTDNLSVLESDTFPWYFGDDDTAAKVRGGDWIAVTAADKKALFRVDIVAPAQTGYVHTTKVVEVSNFVGLITI